MCLTQGSNLSQRERSQPSISHHLPDTTFPTDQTDSHFLLHHHYQVLIESELSELNWESANQELNEACNSQSGRRWQTQTSHRVWCDGSDFKLVLCHKSNFQVSLVTLPCAFILKGQSRENCEAGGFPTIWHPHVLGNLFFLGVDEIKGF